MFEVEEDAKRKRIKGRPLSHPHPRGDRGKGKRKKKVGVLVERYYQFFERREKRGLRGGRRGRKRSALLLSLLPPTAKKRKKKKGATSRARKSGRVIHLHRPPMPYPQNVRGREEGGLLHLTLFRLEQRKKK